MKFVEYQDRSRNRIKSIESQRVLVNQEWIDFPCAISATQIVRAHEIKQDAHLSELLLEIAQHQPANLMLLGSDKPITIDRAWMQLLATMRQQDINLEQMNLDAAARTFNVLTTEDRLIWVVLGV
jgi:uncharacterized protein